MDEAERTTHKGTLPPPPDRSDESQALGMNEAPSERSGSEETLGDEDAEDFLDYLPDRPEEEELSADRLPSMLRGILEDVDDDTSASEDSQGDAAAPSVPSARRVLPPAPEETASGSRQLGEPPDLEVLVEGSDGAKSPMTPKSQWTVMQRAKGAIRRKKKKKSEAALLRSPSRLSEISTGSFIFEDDVISSHSEQVTCGKCRCEVSAACQCCCLYLATFLIVVGIGFLAIGLSLPELSLGAFGLLKQVDVAQGVSDALFRKAWMQMLDLQSFSTPLIPTGNASENAAYHWHSLEVIWQMGPSLSEREKGFRPSVVSDTYLSEVKSAEEALRSLSGWTELCEAVPIEVRFLCTVGDSLVAMAFGSWQEADMEKKLQGMDWEVTFDAQGVPQLPVETLLAFAQQVRPELLERWLPRDSWSLEVASLPFSRQILRSSFLFYLPLEASSRFEALTARAREELLLRQEKSMESNGGLRGFYRIDGRDVDDLELSFKFIPLACFAGANVLLTTLLFTRRLLLCLAALFLVAAAGAASSMIEVRPVTAVTWQLLAVHAAEVALAASSVLSYNGNRVLIKLQMFKDLFSKEQPERGTAWTWISSWLQMPVQLFMPSLGMLLTLLVLSQAVEGIPMAQEAINSALPGIAVILLCGPSLFVPAILMGDWMAEARQERDEPCVSPWLLPKELIWRPLSKDQRRRRRRYALFGILSYNHRGACPLLMLLMLVLAIVAFTRNQEPLSTSTPYLFGDGQLYREGQAAKAALGALPVPERVLQSSLRNATACRIDADSGIECSWFSCTGDKEAELPEESCTCDFRLPFEFRSTCLASAFFSGTNEVPEGFWSWAQQKLGMTFLGNASNAEAPPLEVEDWSTGQNLLQKQVSSSILIQTMGVSCFRAICYCGPRRCVRPEAYQSLGVMPIPVTTSTSLPSTVPTTDVFIVWGLQQQTSTADTDLQWSWSASWMAAPEAQRELLRTCLATPPEFEIISRRCFALDFQQWLESRGERFPVPLTDFPDRLDMFAVDSKEKYFWRSPSGDLAGTVARLRVLRNDLTTSELVTGWQRYLRLRRIAPWSSRAWLAFEDSSLSEAEERHILEVATGHVAAIFVAMLAAWTCVFTCSLRMALAAACSGGFCLLAFFLCRPLIPQSAVLQLWCLVVLVITLVAPVTRFLFFYSSARNGPGRRVKSERSNSFEIQDTMDLTSVSMPGMPLAESTRQESIPRSQTQRLLSVETEETAQLQKEQEEQRRLAQVAAERKEMQSLFRPSAIHSERRNRSTTALCHSAEITVGVVLSLIFSWLTLWSAAPDALAQVARIFPVLAVILLTVILCVSPILILAGLGASRVWRQAMMAYMGAITGWNRRFGGPACSFPELRTPQDDELEISRSIKVLGWPFNRFAESSRLPESPTASKPVVSVTEADTYGLSRQ